MGMDIDIAPLYNASKRRVIAQNEGVLLGPVVQSPIKLILDKWKFNCYIFTIKEGFFHKINV